MGDIYSVVGRLNSAPTVPATILMITAGSTKRCRLKRVEVGARNSSALAGARISIGRPTTAGTGGASYTPQIITDGAPAAIFTALSGTTVWSAEPTQPANYLHELALDVVNSVIWEPTPGNEIIIPTSGRLAFRVEEDNSSTKVQWTITAYVEE